MHLIFNVYVLTIMWQKTQTNDIYQKQSKYYYLIKVYDQLIKQIIIWKNKMIFDNKQDDQIIRKVRLIKEISYDQSFNLFNNPSIYVTWLSIHLNIHILL